MPDDFIAGVVTGAIIMLAIIGVIIMIVNPYKLGQIDSMTGHNYYCQNDRLQWIEGIPNNDFRWKCKDLENE